MFPFTTAQWQELQRQALIYKHIMASVPVPPHLLLPSAARSFPEAPTIFLSPTASNIIFFICLFYLLLAVYFLID